MDNDTLAVLRRRWPVVAAGSVAAGAVLLWRTGAEPRTAAYVVFGALCVALSVLDVALMRLPDALTLPAYPLLAGLLALTGAWGALGRGLTAGAVLLAAHGAAALVLGGALGLGDVKAAGLIGLVLGFAGWPVVVAGMLYAYLSVGVAAVVLVVTGRQGRDGFLPFGPFLLGGALVALAVAA